MVTGEDGWRDQAGSQTLVSLVQRPCTFPVGYQILCETQSSIFLKAPGPGVVPVSDKSGGSGGVQLPHWADSGWGLGSGGGAEQPPAHSPSSVDSVKRSSLPGAAAVRRVQTALLAASISHPLGSTDTVNGPEIECKIKMQQINGCKSHLEPVVRTIFRL